MRIAVIGSGISGLLTAALARRALGGDAEIIRFERASREGGRGQSPELGGKPVNLGPRAVYRGGPFQRALRELGVSATGFSPPAAGALVTDGDQLRPLPGSLGTLLTDGTLAPADKRAFALAAARLAVGALDVGVDEEIGAWLQRHVEPPQARALMETLIRVATYAADPSQSAPLALAQLRRALQRGVLYIDGGWQGLVDGLARCAGPGVHTPVTALADVDADAVVIAGGRDEAAALTGLASLAGPGGPPVTAACLDVVVRRLPHPERRFALGVARPHYFSVHSRPNEKDGVIVHAMVNGSADRTEVEGIIDVVQPGWRDEVVAARYLSRMVVASSLARAGTQRSPVRVDARTLLVGDHVDSGALLVDGCAASARAAVQELVQMHARRRRAA